jgi:hypothetical protein
MMAARDILTLDKPMAPRLIRILYWIALVIILLGVLHGISRGVGIMNRPAPLQFPAASPSSSTTDTMAPDPAPNGWRGRWQRHDGSRFGDRGFQGPGGYRHHGFMMMRHMSPPVRGGFVILFSLIRGLVLVMVVRVLAEMGSTILTLKAMQA